jgi:hypothetical protein
MTLGIVRQAGFTRQNGRNQAFNHAGNMIGAALSGVLGWKFSLTAVFWLAAGFGVLSIISVLMIPSKAIDDKDARGLKDGGDGGKASGFRVLLKCKSLLILAPALACFHLGNRAMLPLYGIALAATKQGDPIGSRGGHHVVTTNKYNIIGLMFLIEKILGKSICYLVSAVGIEPTTL